MLVNHVRYGYAGKILRVNLTRKSVREEDLSRNLVEHYLGGKGFGTWILYNEVSRETAPLGLENKLIFVVGPVTGTVVPTAGRYGVLFKSPLTGIYGESYSGGFFAPKLKNSMYDAMIIEGRASKPSYLLLDSGKADLRDAKNLWGLDTHSTENLLKEELGEKDVEVACIGQAGEKLVKYACICNNYWRQAGRCGAGAVMGSKNLKAIALTGTERVEVAQPEDLREFVREFIKTIKNDPALGETYPKYGTSNIVNIANSHGVFPTRYWKKGVFEKYEKINAEALQKIVISSRSCFACPISCGKLTEVKEGPYKGTKVEGPDYETIFAFGGLCEIDSIEAIAKINDVCDKLGVDTITAGNVVAFAIEAYERGRLKTEEPLQYGDPDIVLTLINKIGRRVGVGAILAEGVKRASEILGMIDVAVHVKGLEPAGYDPRGLKGLGLAYAVASRGACHLRSTEYIYEFRGVVDRFGVKGKAPLIKEYEDRFAIFDSLIICRFLRDVCNWSILAKILQFTTGKAFREENLRRIAERIVNLSRMFNVNMGVSRLDDNLPRRFMEEPLMEGPSNGQVVSQTEMDWMLNEYYRLRGWDHNGVPTDEKRRELSLPRRMKEADK